MKQVRASLLSCVILAVAMLAACPTTFAPSVQAQTGEKSGAEKAGAATKPSAAAKTGDKAAAKPKSDAPKAESPKAEVPKEAPPVVKQTPKPKPEVTVPKPTAEPEKPSPKVAPEKAAPTVIPPPTPEKVHPVFSRRQGLMAGITIFVLALLVGWELVKDVPRSLHTPLMTLSIALSGITVIGALLVAGQGFHFSSFLGFFAVTLAVIKIVGGFLVTHRMLLMFQRK